MNRIAVLALCGVVALGTPLSLIGTWEGTFHGQPTRMKADGSYPEIVTRFELSLTVDAGITTGVLTVFDHPMLTVRVNNIRCDSTGCGFEVIDNAEGEVMTWRVQRHGMKLTGSRNKGRMTPLGIGSGARIFAISGEKISK